MQEVQTGSSDLYNHLACLAIFKLPITQSAASKNSSAMNVLIESSKIRFVSECKAPEVLCTCSLTSTENQRSFRRNEVAHNSNKPNSGNKTDLGVHDVFQIHWAL